MPRTELNISSNLSIQLEAQPQTFAPGNTIIGKVVRKTHLVSPQVTLNIRLQGRAKSKLVVKRNNDHGHTTRTYRGRFNFFALNEVASRIYSGPVHIPPGGESSEWPFALTIPASANPQALASSGEYPSYLTLGNGQVYPLPNSFFYFGGYYRTKFEGYVEYYLEADFIATIGGKNEVTTASLPIMVQTPTTRLLSTPQEFALRMEYGRVDARSYFLTQDTQVEKLTFKQKLKSSVGSSKVPIVVCNVQQSSPGVIQLGNIIPFAIRVMIDPVATSEELRDNRVTFQLVSLHMRLKSNTEVLCEGLFSNHGASEDDTYDFGLYKLIPKLKPVMLPVGQDAKFMDIGELLQLTLNQTGVMALGQQVATFQIPAFPSMTTYNIKQTHRIKWEIGIKVGRVEKIFEISGQRPVTVIGCHESMLPSLNQDVLCPPPPMEDSSVAPPSYEEQFENHQTGALEENPMNEKSRLEQSYAQRDGELGESSSSANPLPSASRLNENMAQLKLDRAA
ncbi:Hypothetical protein R9X50_00068000 [Acrodontium crateriforme]|uniref:Arrestin-like N-terminal domain-containing protein n=1 Tax=Acrodontium crateriforme TaxID=150365 RepID=A0AAQ3R9D2_9PEZI|nr:Hypothetical protein R9X50_00068000 [Acrodontium crateriforme]